MQNETESMFKHYILDENGEPKAVELLVWAEWFENCENRRVALTEIGNFITVSTVFLGLDHSFVYGPHVPVLWETMIFGGKEDNYQDRYCSKEAALEGHERAVKLAKKGRVWFEIKDFSKFLWKQIKEVWRKEFHEGGD